MTVAMVDAPRRAATTTRSVERRRFIDLLPQPQAVQARAGCGAMTLATVAAPSNAMLRTNVVKIRFDMVMPSAAG